MKHRHAIGFRRVYNELKRDVKTTLTEILKKAEDNQLVLYDDKGSLILNSIDDQENEVIMSAKLCYPDKVIVSYGVFEEDNEMAIEDLSIELMLNVLDAAEAALEDE
jgi:hypothetical protein